MSPLTQSQVQTWLDEFHDAMSAPIDFNRLKPIMSKRVTVDMPGEPKIKKFEDWEKKSKDYYTYFKSAKRSIPKNSLVSVTAAKKDEVDVIAPQLCMFTWTKDLGEIYKNVNLSSGDKCKIFIYDRMKLSSKSECSQYSPLFNSTDFQGADRAYDDDTFGHRFVKALNAGGEELAKLCSDDMVAEFGASGKMNKDQWTDLESKLSECKYEVLAPMRPVMGISDKDNIAECIIPVARTFKWSAALTDVFKVEFSEGSLVRLVSYDQLKVKENKVLSLVPQFDAAVHLKPAGGKSAGN